MTIHHVGFAVENLETAIATYEKLGFTLSRTFEKPEPKARVASMKDAKGTGLELWQFQEEHPLRGYIGRHTAFLCENVQNDYRVLLDAGFREVIPFTKGVIMDYVFMKDKNGLVYELAQEKNTSGSEGK